MKKILKRISFLLSSVLLYQNSSSFSAEIGEVQVHKENYEIIQKEKKIGSFRIEAGKLVKADGNAEFSIKLKDISANVKEIKLPEADETVKVVTNNGALESEPIRIKIKNRKGLNKVFHSYNQLNFVTTDNEQAKSEELKFTISPDISITTDRNSVNFGTLTYNNGYIFGTEQSFYVNYTILDDARCQVQSKYNFRLKHRNSECFIPYKLSSSTNVTSDGKNKYFDLPSEKSSIEFRVNINEFMSTIPTAGDYEDDIVLTVVPKE